MIRKPKLGVIVLPMIFGGSKSFDAYVRNLAAMLGANGEVTTVSLYKDGEKAPFFLPYVAGRRASQRRNNLVATLDDYGITHRIVEATSRLNLEHGCNKIVVVGFGYGGIAAIRAASRLNADIAGLISGVVAWYPRLIMPQGTGKTAPDLAAVGCPVLMFYGNNDKETAGSAELARTIAAQPGADIKVRVYFGAGHAFADRFIQDRWPNPLYHREYGPESRRDSGYWLLQLLRQSAG